MCDYRLIEKGVKTAKTKRPLIGLWYDESMGYQELLHHYPPAEIVDETDPDYPLLEAAGGCRVCARGEPCQDRIETDIDDILAEAGLTEAERVACLQWLLAQGKSSLSDSIVAIAEAFQKFRQG